MVILLDHTPEIKIFDHKKGLDGLQGKKFHSYHADWITMKWEQESRCLEGEKVGLWGIYGTGDFPSGLTDE
jgi:hypothetical protein